MAGDIAVLNLLPLIHLRRLLNLAFLPVRPSEEFRRRLRQQLEEDARRLQAVSKGSSLHILGNSIPLPGRRELLIGAAVGSAVSLAGLIAILIHVLGGSKEPRAHAA